MQPVLKSRCTQCGSEFLSEATHCSQCGSSLTNNSASLHGDNALTVDAVDETNVSKPDPSDTGRYPSGSMIADRYRIVSLLGRGGMGEVYRAEDLTLGQTVALKFLPEAMIDEFTLERFRNEVRMARRVSHPSVCRVYDFGEANHQVFLSMEFVDGDDLSVLLRRVHRFSSDKALEIARKICAGLAAAHDKGVLHRDLKPSNIMIDRRGGAFIMDFGLAGLAHEIEDTRSGTPAYMAPEQRAGEEVTPRSDIYALGLVLYELFTGKSGGKLNEEIQRARSEGGTYGGFPLGDDLDPTLEMVIRRCLEQDPDDRPSSALIVSAALPGGEYLLSIYRPDHYDPSAETEAMARDIDVLNDEMMAAGARVFVCGLSAPGSATSFRISRDGEPLVAPGPYTHGTEHVAGFWVLKAADLNEALAWGRKAAIACRASVEVRPFDYPK